MLLPVLRKEKFAIDLKTLKMNFLQEFRNLMKLLWKVQQQA